MIQNLSQLKKELKTCPRLEITGHLRPECVGQIRRVTLVNTRGLYSAVEGQPDHKFSRANEGWGAYLEWGKAEAWSFEDGICAVYERGMAHTREHLIMAFRVLDAA